MGGITGEISGDLTGLQDRTSPIITRTLMRYLKDYDSRLRIARASAVRLPLTVFSWLTGLNPPASELSGCAPRRGKER